MTTADQLTRTVPVSSELRAYLLEHKQNHRWLEHRHDGLIFRRTAARTAGLALRSDHQAAGGR